MKVRWAIQAAVLALALVTTAPAAARVTAAEAARLGAELTPLGATRAGNESGTIPAWEGGIKEPPPGYRRGGHLVDPFPDDKPLFTITADNFGKYEANLTPGQIAVIRRYPKTYRMPVYQTRRTASLPPRIYERTIANATTAMLTEDGNGVVNAAEGVPFPIPRNGLEAVWNHLLRYRGRSARVTSGQAAPTAAGAYVMVQIREQVLWGYQQPGATTDNIDNKLAYFLQEVLSPARLAGTLVLVHETLNQAAEPRKAWVYNPGQRRVRRAANVSHDNPGTGSDGQRTNDQADMYNGAPDRYDWKLVGKREIYIPYNSYKLASDRYRFDDILKPGHINPDLTRYELHRVWVVEATLKEGARHIYPRRTFYLDEDSWQIAVADQYDARGDIWRLSQSWIVNHYQVPVLWQTGTAVYDVQNGRYVAKGLTNEYEAAEFDIPLDRKNFTPQSLRRRGRR